MNRAIAVAKQKLKIAILGSRGIPNRYGGFEQFAEKLSVGLVSKGMDVWVYNSHNHPDQSVLWEGVHRILCYDPEFILGQGGQFIYDLNCINDSRRRDFDVILQLGTTSSTIWHRRMPRGAVIVTNMDGLEWQRTKYNRAVRRFLKYAEKLGVEKSDYLVADSRAIGHYLKHTYNASSSYIAYGADIPEQPVEPVERSPAFGTPDHPCHDLILNQGGFFLVIARLQPDNHLEEVIQGVLASESALPLLVVGHDTGSYARFLKRKYGGGQVLFTGGIYEADLLNRLRSKAKLYFHGHSAGGTNPSLLEAMAAGALICAHDNPFNREVLENDAFYFDSSETIATIVNSLHNAIPREDFVDNNMNRIKTTYNWERIIDAYHELFLHLCHKDPSAGHDH